MREVWWWLLVLGVLGLVILIVVATALGVIPFDQLSEPPHRP